MNDFPAVLQPVSAVLRLQLKEGTGFSENSELAPFFRSLLAPTSRFSVSLCLSLCQRLWALDCNFFGSLQLHGLSGSLQCANPGASRRPRRKGRVSARRGAGKVKLRRQCGGAGCRATYHSLLLSSKNWFFHGLKNLHKRVVQFNSFYLI